MTDYLNTDFDFDSDNLIEVLDELPIWSAPFGLKLLDKVILKKDISALDIGFGAGFPLTELAMRLGNSCKVYGIDPWEAAIKRVEKKIVHYGISNVEIIKSAAEIISLPDQSIDLIVSNNGLNNVADLEKVFSECSRIMKSGGQFVQSMNLNTTMIEFYDILEEVLKAHGLADAKEIIDNHIYKKRRPVEEIRELSEKYSFTVKEVEHSEFDYKFADGTTMLNHYFIRLAFLNSWKDLVPKEKIRQIFSEIEEKMNKMSEKQGYFRLSVPFVIIDCVKN